MFAALQLYQINHLLTSRCFLESRKFPCNKLLLGLIFKENVYATVLNALEQFYPEAEEVFFFFFFFNTDKFRWREKNQIQTPRPILKKKKDNDFLLVKLAAGTAQPICPHFHLFSK